MLNVPDRHGMSCSIRDLETPRLLLDRERLERNCARMRERCAALGVSLRPHLKTAKSLDVARIAVGGEPSGLTVSTLKEADYFASGGYTDILYATAIVPNKFVHAAGLIAAGTDLLLVTDSIEVVIEAERFAALRGLTFSFLIEIDCGEHRSGLEPDAAAIVALSRAIGESAHLSFRGLMTHAGHSYATDDVAEVRRLAALERDAAVNAADRVRAAGIACEIVSVGSTPTVLHVDHLNGVTEVRSGIYMVWDLAQASRNMCREDDIALSVAACVIGHNRAGRSLIIDSGALALSKDLGANRFRPDVGYGTLHDALDLKPLGRLSVTGVHQEHGTVAVEDEAWFDRLPVGSLVRVLPNHACITAAAYDAYDVVEGERVVDRWPRISGW